MANPRVVDLAAALPVVNALFAERHTLAVLYVHFPNTEIIEERFGDAAISTLLHIAAQRLNVLARGLDSEACVARHYADDLVLFLATDADPTELAERILRDIPAALRRVDEELAELMLVHVGHRKVTAIDKMRSERQLENAIQQALLGAVDAERHALDRRLHALRGAIRGRAFRMLYQPIVAENGRVFAYEALVRTQVPELASPLVLFDTAERTRNVWTLSRVLRELAVQPLDKLTNGTLLFVNLHPHDFEDPQLLQMEEFMKPWANRIVFELTERAAIEDYQRLKGNTKRLIELGFRIAVDDLGAGYASLNSVAHLEPQFIKIDMGLVRNIDREPSQQRVARTIMDFAREMGSEVIAEGIETEAELNVLRDLGVPLMQGYLFSRPEPPFAIPKFRFDARSGAVTSPPSRQ